ncbi:MAG: pyrroline-5-carboxylate reductase [Nitrospiraceae bacterium]|nr:MAG: pyrroline-5-carboxylate reductase [Nitrospiraceae bacterium]
MKIGFIGGGNMAEAMIKGMTSHGLKDIIVSEPTQERRQYLNKTYDTATTASNREVVESAEIIILAVKPQNMDTVINEISFAVTENKTIVSIAAGIKLDYLTSKLNSKKIIRVMPNTPALVQEGMSVMSLCECFSDHAVSVVREILMSIGKVITLPEKYMDAVTAVSGSGPGFIAFFIEAIIDSAIKMGLSEDDARMLSVQTAIGTARLLDTGMSPSRLREMVTSPGGTTEAGLRTLKHKGLNDTVLAAMSAARDRSYELGRKSD